MRLSSTNGIFHHSPGGWGFSGALSISADKVRDRLSDAFGQEKGGWRLSLARLVKDQVTAAGEVSPGEPKNRKALCVKDSCCATHAFGQGTTQL